MAILYCGRNFIGISRTLNALPVCVRACSCVPLVSCVCVCVGVMINILNEVSQCVYVINKVHCHLGCFYIYTYIYSVHLTVFAVLCASLTLGVIRFYLTLHSQKAPKLLTFI